MRVVVVYGAMLLSWKGEAGAGGDRGSKQNRPGGGSTGLYTIY
jgi:hypothetical protein